MAASGMARRHIQDPSAADVLEPHFGYPGRVVPCAVDQGSCEYLDDVYRSHDLGIIFTGVFWLTVGGILFVWGVGRGLAAYQRGGASNLERSIEGANSKPRQTSTVRRLRNSIAAWSRRYLLPESVVSVFGHTTRLQVLMLAILIGYLTLWSFIGIAYKKWITPVKNTPGSYNTRTSLGPWSDRVGILAYALTPLSILLSSRESILSLATGIPYQSFLFLHRWTGYIIIAQSVLHTIGWTLVEAKFYQPQPKVWNAWIVQDYIIWGWAALGVLLLLYILSLPWVIRGFGYEFFRKAHYVLAMVYIGAVIAHWKALQCYLVPGLVLWFVDRAVRLVRTGMLHYQYLPQKGRMGFAAADAAVTRFADEQNGDVVRLDFKHPQRPWKIGQHYYLCFTEGSIWQSHPFTPLNVPEAAGEEGGLVSHAYIFRAKSGETKKIAEKVCAKFGKTEGQQSAEVTTPVILTGPYGESIINEVSSMDNILCVAGGTGITYVLPVLLDLITKTPRQGRKIELIWAIRRESDLHWLEPEMKTLRGPLGKKHGVKIRVFVTREAADDEPLEVEEKETAVTTDGPCNCASASASSSRPSQDDVAEPRMSISHPQQGVSILHPHATDTAQSRRPHLDEEVDRFVSSVESGPTVVFASGPMGMIRTLRTAVAAKNDGGKVLKGDSRHDVRLACDDRIEW